MIEPVPSCVEIIHYGPVAKREIEWMEIDPIVRTKVGVRVPERVEDRTQDLLDVLAQEGIAHTRMGRLMRVTAPSPQP